MRGARALALEAQRLAGLVRDEALEARALAEREALHRVRPLHAQQHEVAGLGAHAQRRRSARSRAGPASAPGGAVSAASCGVPVKSHRLRSRTARPGARRHRRQPQYTLARSALGRRERARGSRRGRSPPAQRVTGARIEPRPRAAGSRRARRRARVRRLAPSGQTSSSRARWRADSRTRAGARTGGSAPALSPPLAAERARAAEARAARARSRGSRRASRSIPRAGGIGGDQVERRAADDEHLRWRENRGLGVIPEWTEKEPRRARASVDSSPRADGRGHPLAAARVGVEHALGERRGGGRTSRARGRTPVREERRKCSGSRRPRLDHARARLVEQLSRPSAARPPRRSGARPTWTTR